MALIIASGTTGVAIFSNGIDTRTHGADLVFNFPTDYALFNETDITKIPGTPAQLTGLSLYNATALSDLTSASPKYVVNLGVLWTSGKASINLLEKIYGPSAKWENDANLDLGCQIAGYFRVNIGALNLFDRYPNKLNDVLRSHYANLAYNDILGVQQYPSFSAFDQNFGIHCARCDCFNSGGKDISCT